MLLDTCFCIDLMRERSKGQNGPAIRKMKIFADAEIFISLFTLCELRSGAELSNNPIQELKKVELITSFAEVLYPESSFSVLYGELESFLRKNGMPMPVMDLLIAVSAKAAGIPIITRDAAHFNRVPGLVVEEY
ncbi:MAG: type II toxin-antitoxin system VapC family toxin [Spirochaetales bacterium]|jgi:tRNA(fMet)-specific endonuclease VapC|nr:type II toxin-antitoxin system VapC family toxin [Spirochaetales bacterium]